MFMADSWFALRHPEYDRDFERNRPNRHPLKSSSYMNFRNNANAHEFEAQRRSKSLPQSSQRVRRSHNQKPKSTTEARRHGEDQNQFSPRKTQRSRATTKTILYHRGHEGTRRGPKPKLTAEVAKHAQRAQSRTEAIKF